MKKLILLLVFIPLFTYSQTFEDISEINSYEQFVRVMIENGYELDEKLPTGAIYIKNPVISNGERLIEVMATYNNKTNVFHLMFWKKNSDSKTKYENIFSEVKNKCNFSKIIPEEDVPIYMNGGDWALYSCNKISYSGSIGFTQKNNWLILMNGF